MTVPQEHLGQRQETQHTRVFRVQGARKDSKTEDCVRLWRNNGYINCPKFGKDTNLLILCKINSETTQKKKIYTEIEFSKMEDKYIGWSFDDIKP